jgi:serine/threonine-protein kinase
VTILDSGEFGGVPYIAMEHVAGDDLRVRLDSDGQLPVGVAATYMIQICEALDYVHLKQIYHRDLKPENVLVSSGGAVKVMDFGIALAKGLPRLSTDGVRWLSGGYLCPDREVTAASDLYMLGVLFYEMLAGRLPFVSNDLIELLRMHEDAPVPPMHEHRQDVPEPVEAVARKLLAKDPADRFQQAVDVIRELRPYAAPTE